MVLVVVWVKLVAEGIKDKKSRAGGYHKVGFEGGANAIATSLA